MAGPSESNVSNALRPATLRQLIHEEGTLHFQCTFGEELPPATEDLDLQISDTELHLCLDGRVLAMSFPMPIMGSSAVAKISRKRNTLTVTTMLEANTRSSRMEARASIGGLWRGNHILEFLPAEKDVLESRRHFVLVSRTGRFAELGEGTAANPYSWCFTFTPSSPLSRVLVTIDAYAWIWDERDAMVTFGPLADGETPPEIETGLEQVGVDFEVRTNGGGSDDTMDATVDGGAVPRFSHTFVPDEEAHLPSPELKFACRCYYRAFANVDGYELSGQFVRRRPPAPTWTTAEAADGVVVDNNYASLTYGEAEFVPLYQLLITVGMPANMTVVDIGSGSGRMVMCVALAFPSVREVRGIELVPDLHAGATAACGKLAAVVPSGAMAPVRLIEGDILSVPWEDADLVLATSLCFPYPLQTAVRARALQLRHGARIICMQSDFDDPSGDEEDEDEGAKNEARPRSHEDPSLRPVPVRQVAPVHEICMQMSFGEAKFYVFEVVHDGHSPQTVVD